MTRTFQAGKMSPSLCERCEIVTQVKDCSKLLCVCFSVFVCVCADVCVCGGGGGLFFLA